MIREAKIEDAKKLDNLLTLLVQDERQYDSNISPLFVVIDYHKNYLKKKNNICYVYEENNDIVAYIDGLIVNDGTDVSDTFKINALFVKEEYRDKGIATDLMNKIIEDVDQRNITNIEIGVLSNNVKAKKLYEKFNFKTYKEIMSLKR